MLFPPDMSDATMLPYAKIELHYTFVSERTRAEDEYQISLLYKNKFETPTRGILDTKIYNL